MLVVVNISASRAAPLAATPTPRHSDPTPCCVTSVREHQVEDHVAAPSPSGPVAWVLIVSIGKGDVLRHASERARNRVVAEAAGVRALELLAPTR